MVHFVKKEKEKSQSTLKSAICHHTYPIILWSSKRGCWNNGKWRL